LLPVPYIATTLLVSALMQLVLMQDCMVMEETVLVHTLVQTVVGCL